jgi:hypothetical protein
MKQTAVDWLIKEYSKYVDDSNVPFSVLEKAKEMEKEQMVDFTMDFMGEDNSYESYRRASALDLFNKTFNIND